MFQVLRNAWVDTQLRKKILYTLFIIILFRFGSNIIVPFVDSSAVQNMVGGVSLLNYLDVMTGGSLGKGTLLAMSITPYINASIIIQLLGIMVPAVQKLQKEGESGRRKMNQWTRLLTIVVLCIQGPAYMANLYNTMPQEAFVYGGTFYFFAYATVILIAGTMFTMWLGERITDKGIGNGVSMIIMIGIVARLPQALMAEFTARVSTSTGSLIMFVVELALLFLVFLVSIAVIQAVRKVPVQYAKRIIGNKQYGGVRQYIPLKMNAANVMPIIFAQALVMVPALIPGLQGAFANIQGFWYNFTLAVLVIAFTYFYTAIIINPQMMADDMKRNGGFIPGVKPGKQTVNYIDTIMTRITLPGSIFLALVAIMPGLAMKFLGIQQQFAYFYGGTSLLIMVGVVLDTLKQIESYLLMRHYDGLMKTGRIQGRY
mgnify:CR=1 FL=1